MTMRCAKCRKTPEETPEYVAEGRINGMTPEEFVKEKEGTYQKEIGSFLCTECYVAVGMPLRGRY